MSADYTIHEASELVIALRGDLQVIPHGGGAQPHYILEDPIRGRYFRVGPREYALLSQLDGRTTLAEAVARTARRLGRDALSTDDAVAIGRWLIENQLASTPASTSATRLESSAIKESVRDWRARLNPLFARVPLVRPDRSISWLAPWTAFIFSWPCFVLWLLICAAGLLTGVREAGAFVAEARQVVQPASWLSLGVVWFALKLIHELAHAVACKKFGGTVPRAGVQFILFAPMAYVDVTSSWRLASKWQRIVVSAAGMYVELLAAAVAMLVWSRTEPGAIHEAAHHVVLLAGVGSLLFNANPLMRFDGYFILSDWLEIPNLYASGSQYTSYLFQKYVLGRDASLPDWSNRARRWIKPFGVTACLWRGFVMLVLSLGLVGLWPYLGAMLAGSLWVGFAVTPLIRELRRPISWRSWRRPVMTTVAAAGLLIAAIALLSRPGNVSAWGVVEFGPLHVVRAGGRGFVRAIHVRDGEFVEADQVIAVLENEELRSELADLVITIRQSRLRQQQHLGQQEYAKLEVEVAQQQALEKKRVELEVRFASLTVRAGAAGRVIRRDIDTLLGRHVELGATIALVGNESAKELLVGVPQDDVELFRDRLGGRVEFRPHDCRRDAMEGTLSHVDPRAIVEPPHATLSARYGGPLAVQVRAEATARESAPTNVAYELLSPVFHGTVQLAPDQSRELFAGQLVVVRFRTEQESAARRAWRWVHEWIDQQVRGVSDAT